MKTILSVVLLAVATGGCFILVAMVTESVRFFVDKQRFSARMKDIHDKGWIETLHEIFLEPVQPSSGHQTQQISDRWPLLL